MAMTKSDTLNYRDELFLVGANKTPFLNMIGGLSGGKRSKAFTFSLGNYYTLDAGAQTVQSEDTAVTAGTPATKTIVQASNVCQIMKRDASVSFKKESTIGQMSGINADGENGVSLTTLDFQKKVVLEQLAKDIEVSFLSGTYVAEGATSVAQSTRGIVTAITTNAIAAGGKALSKALIDECLRAMAGNGSPFNNVVMFASAIDVQRISDIYGYAPMDRAVGGVNVKTILTSFATLSIVWTPQLPAGTVLFADVSVVAPVFVPCVFSTNGPSVSMEAGADLLWVPTAVTAAAYGGFYYTQIGLDYAMESYHGKITGLATA
jgi:hypothetical protein